MKKIKIFDCCSNSFNAGDVIFCNNQVPFALNQHRDRAKAKKVSIE